MPHVTDSPESALLARTAIACLTAAACCLTAGPPIIHWLKRRLTERISSDSATLDALHATKQGTPTMGGILMVGALLAGFSLCSDAAGSQRLMAGVTTCIFALLGAADDWIKATTKRKGLSVRQKLAGQVLLATTVSACLIEQQSAALSQNHWSEAIPAMLWAAFVLIASCNAVNLTDGLDGLAAGSLGICAAALAVILLQTTQTIGAGQMMAVLSTTAMSFLWFNHYPARIFMGDTGALAIGALLGLLALQAGREWLLCAAGAVFAVETLSVVAQVVWFRCTRRRLLLCSPLHNHYVFRKIPEPSIVRAFWAAGLLAAAATILLA